MAENQQRRYSDVNSCSFGGRLAADPETRQAGQTTITSFRVLSNRYDNNGQEQKVVTWRVQAWGKFGEALGAQLRKGMYVRVSEAQKIDGQYVRDIKDSTGKATGQQENVYTTDFQVYRFDQVTTELPRQMSSYVDQTPDEEEAEAPQPATRTPARAASAPARQPARRPVVDEDVDIPF